MNIASHTLFHLLRLLATASLLAGIAASALAGTFSDNGDGTVTDSATGLTWMRCAAGQTWTGETCSGTAHTSNYPVATTPWRLPNIRELQTIVDWSASNPAIDIAAFPNTPSSTFWSSSPVSGSSTSVWDVSFYTGSAQYWFATYARYARFVSGGRPTDPLLDLARPTTDYVDHGDGTATHVPTNLTWKRCAEGQTWSGTTCVGTASNLTADQAATLNTSFAGTSGWRLPSQEELLSLIDYTTTNPAINTAIFPATPSSWGSCFWSASAAAHNSSKAWSVSFQYGLTKNFDRSENCSVRFVRNEQSLDPLLTSGWNLLGNSISEALSVATAFGDPGKVNSVWKWVPGTSKWAIYTPSMDGTALAAYAASKGYDVLTTVGGGEGFWVNAKTHFSVNQSAGIPVTTASFSTTLVSGWSLIAVADAPTPRAFTNATAISQPPAGAVAATDGLTSLWTWDAALARWYFYAPSLDNTGELGAYATSKGYLDFGTSVLGPATGFWVHKP